MLAGEDDWGSAVTMADAAVACAVRAIRALGLKVAAQKTVAVFFHDGSWGRPPEANILEGVRVPIGAQMKYLGLVLGVRWCFGEHFARPEIG